MAETSGSSAGHRLGQLIGDWYEQYIAYALLREVARKLDLYLDSRFVTRLCRGSKLLWPDGDGNTVDYDFVLELGGSSDKRGVPVAFFECFWRRGSRHSKDKARDDSGKLMPMRQNYPTARFLGITAAGDFTKPASELVRSRGIDLFYVPKNKIIEAFDKHGLMMEYPDKLSEEQKARLVNRFSEAFGEEAKTNVAETLFDLVGISSVRSYVDRVSSSLSALPQSVRFILLQQSEAVSFDSITAASEFLERPHFSMTNPTESYCYQITYSDGSEFEIDATSLEELQELHAMVERLSEHMTAVHS